MKPRIAACLFVRDEAQDIAEWLAFHHVVGIDHVLVFDNTSRDGTRGVVRHAARFASIRLVPWPITHRRAQIAAYGLGLRLLRRFDWVAFLDSDEFLTPTTDRPLADILAALPQASAVAVNWAFFGSGGHAETPSGRLVVEAYRRRAEDGFDENRVVKSIVRPRGAKPRNPHAFDLPGGYVRPDGRPVALVDAAFTPDAPDYGLLRVGHYFTRSRAHWRRKMARGYRDIERREDLFDHYDRNEVEDDLAARFAPAVRDELARRGQASG